MQIVEPTTEEIAAAIAANPYRYPEVVHLTVVGDRGARVRLPFIIGNPSGSTPVVKPLPVWRDFVAAVLKRDEFPGGAEAGVSDCLLWPNAVTWSEWSDRWPALAGQLWRAAKTKCGADMDLIVEPDYDDPNLPVDVKAALAQFPRASLRRFESHSAKVLFLIDPPAPVVWRIFMDSMKVTGGDTWKHAREMAQVCTKFVFDEQTGGPVAFDKVIGEWPGFALMTCRTVAVLAGAAAEVELGE